MSKGAEGAGGWEITTSSLSQTMLSSLDDYETFRHGLGGLGVVCKANSKANHVYYFSQSVHYFSHDVHYFSQDSFLD